MATSSRSGGGEDDDVDLVVDEDDSATFGPSQYSEADVVVPSADGVTEQKEREALREAVIRLLTNSLVWSLKSVFNHFLN